MFNHDGRILRRLNCVCVCVAVRTVHAHGNLRRYNHQDQSSELYLPTRSVDDVHPQRLFYRVGHDGEYKLAVRSSSVALSVTPSWNCTLQMWTCADALSSRSRNTQLSRVHPRELANTIAEHMNHGGKSVGHSYSVAVSACVEHQMHKVQLRSFVLQLLHHHRQCNCRGLPAHAL